jgi:sulfhydrogenase subunit beta (sulfur reductase)
VTDTATARRASDARLVIERAGLDRLLDVLREAGYRILGPRVGGGAVVHGDIASVADLPVGQSSEQAPGRYRFKTRDDGAVFGFGNGAHSWKQFLHPPSVRLFRARREGAHVTIVPDEPASEKVAFLGVRPCDLQAIARLDQVLADRAHADEGYRLRRAGVFIVVANCTEAGGTCFCASLGTGPRATSGFDLALTEVIVRDRHYFVVDVASDAAAQMMAAVPAREAGDQELAEAAEAVDRAAAGMGRAVDTADLPGRLARTQEAPAWDECARACLSCANCTMVCPTCFCTTVADSRAPAGDEAERSQQWDSCFTAEFSYVHSGVARQSPPARYRQWLTHKFSNWVGQFGAFGCVGCGRCITWCPVGIDVTVELRRVVGDSFGGARTPDGPAAGEHDHGRS